MNIHFYKSYELISPNLLGKFKFQGYAIVGLSPQWNSIQDLFEEHDFKQSTFLVKTDYIAMPAKLIAKFETKLF